MYVGAIDEWFDFATVDRLTEALPNVSFVLIGPAEEARRRLVKTPEPATAGTSQL